MVLVRRSEGLTPRLPAALRSPWRPLSACYLAMQRHEDAMRLFDRIPSLMTNKVRAHHDGALRRQGRSHLTARERTRAPESRKRVGHPCCRATASPRWR